MFQILADFLESLANSGSCKSSKIFRQSCHVLRCRKSFKDWNNCSKCKPNRPLIAGAGHDDDGESSSWTDMSSMTKQLLGTFQQQLVNASDEQAKKHHNNPLALKISEVTFHSFNCVLVLKVRSQCFPAKSGFAPIFDINFRRFSLNSLFKKFKTLPIHKLNF